MTMLSFKDKKVAILGTGVEGISSARYLKSQGALVTLLDQKNQDQLPNEVVAQAQNLKVDVFWGPGYLKTLNKFDLIIRTPGIRPDLPELLEAKRRGLEVSSNTKIFFDLCPCPIIGVTGTKGKGTTSTLIAKILEKAGKGVYLGGNIGKPPLDFLLELKSEDWVVLELSSFQLFDLTQSPHVAVVLMVTSEHLDWHVSSQEYKEAKFNIASHQTEKDFAVVNVDHPASKEFLEVGSGKKVNVSGKRELDKGVYVREGLIYRRFGPEEKVIETGKVGLIGPHNLENVVAAVGAVSVLDIPLEPIVEAIQEFKGLEHRLEFVRELDGVKYYNDSFSTTPETAIAAIKSFTQPEIVILGGSDKGSDYTELGQVISSAKNIKALVLIGLMGPKIKEAIEKFGGFRGKILEGAKNMEEIVSQARGEAKSGNVVLMSPACASFDMFKNYKHRGELFKEEVRKL